MTFVAERALTPPRFVAESEAFAARWGRDPLFRLLGWTLRCEGADLGLLVKKIHSMSVPENTHELREPLSRAYLGLAGLPLLLLLRRRAAWTAQPRRDFLLETISPDYFNQMFSEMYDLLPENKAISPRAPADFSGRTTTAPIMSSVSLSDVLRLIVAAPLASLLSLALAARSGVHCAQAWRKAASIYASHRGHFRRFPSRVFITFADELNHPARWLAFRHSGGESLVAIQNGERTVHPSFAFGKVDRYFVFGPRYERILRAVAAEARFEHSGALCLNEYHALLAPLLGQERPRRWDILYFDQGFSHNGLTDATNASLMRIAENLGRLQAESGLRVAYQLRGYGPGETAKRAVVDETLRRLLPKAEVLENEVRGTSYKNALDAELLLTFQSTIGFEMMALGKKTLFVNYSGDATETVCSDARFQLEDPAADPARFAAKVRELLALRLDGPPEEARERHPYFDGAVQRRVAEALLRETA